jgi:hypothetical protein
VADPFAAQQQQAAAAIWGYEDALSPPASARSWPYNRGNAGSDSGSGSSCDGIGVRPTAAAQAAAALGGAGPPAIQHAPPPGTEDGGAVSEPQELEHATSFAGFQARSLPGTPQALALEAGAPGFASGRPAPVGEEQQQQQIGGEEDGGGGLDDMFSEAAEVADASRRSWGGSSPAGGSEGAVQEEEQQEQGGWGADWSSAAQAQPQQAQAQPAEPAAAAAEQQQQQEEGGQGEEQGDGEGGQGWASPQPLQAGATPGSSPPALSPLMSGRLSESAYPAWSQQNSATHSRWAGG